MVPSCHLHTFDGQKSLVTFVGGFIHPNQCMMLVHQNKNLLLFSLTWYISISHKFVTSVAALMFSDSCFHSLINSRSKSKLLIDLHKCTLHTVEVCSIVWTNISDIFRSSLKLNDSNSSLNNICHYVFTTSNKPTGIFIPTYPLVHVAIVHLSRR